MSYYGSLTPVKSLKEAGPLAPLPLPLTNHNNFTCNRLSRQPITPALSRTASLQPLAGSFSGGGADRAAKNITHNPLFYFVLRGDGRQTAAVAGKTLGDRAANTEVTAGRRAND